MCPMAQQLPCRYFLGKETMGTGRLAVEHSMEQPIKKWWAVAYAMDSYAARKMNYAQHE